MYILTDKEGGVVIVGHRKYYMRHLLEKMLIEGRDMSIYRFWYGTKEKDLEFFMKDKK